MTTYMVRTGGRVNWELRAENRFNDGISSGNTRKFLLRSRLVRVTDVVVFIRDGFCKVLEADVMTENSILIRRSKAKVLSVSIDGKALTNNEVIALAVNAGFDGPRDMDGFMETRGMFSNGIFEGQVIGW